jgi:hypothetical protein
MATVLCARAAARTTCKFAPSLACYHPFSATAKRSGGAATTGQVRMYMWEQKGTRDQRKHRRDARLEAGPAGFRSTGE